MAQEGAGAAKTEGDVKTESSDSKGEFVVDVFSHIPSDRREWKHEYGDLIVGGGVGTLRGMVMLIVG